MVPKRTMSSSTGAPGITASSRITRISMRRRDISSHIGTGRQRGKKESGLHFLRMEIIGGKKKNTPVIRRGGRGDPFSVREDPGTHEFWMYHKSAISSQPASVFGGASLRKVARVVSKDFVHWKDDEIVLEPDTLDQPDTEFYGLSPFPYGNQYLGFLWVLHTYSQQIDVQLVSSRDGLAWDRSVHRRVFLPLGFVRNGYNGRGFDSEMIMSIAPPTVKDGKLWMYYSGFNVKHNSTQSEE